MPTFPPTPRQHRDEASLVLETDQAQNIREVRTFARRLLRALDRVEENRSSAFDELRLAQELQDAAWNGAERRRVAERVSA